MCIDHTDCHFRNTTPLFCRKMWVFMGIFQLNPLVQLSNLQFTTTSTRRANRQPAVWVVGICGYFFDFEFRLPVGRQEYSISDFNGNQHLSFSVSHHKNGYFKELVYSAPPLLTFRRCWCCHQQLAGGEWVYFHFTKLPFQLSYNIRKTYDSLKFLSP